MPVGTTVNIIATVVKAEPKNFDKSGGGSWSGVKMRIADDTDLFSVLVPGDYLLADDKVVILRNVVIWHQRFKHYFDQRLLYECNCN